MRRADDRKKARNVLVPLLEVLCSSRHVGKLAAVTVFAVAAAAVVAVAVAFPVGVVVVTVGAVATVVAVVKCWFDDGEINLVYCCCYRGCCQ